MKLFNVEWKTSLQGQGWVVRSDEIAQPLTFLFSWLELLRLPRYLRRDRVEERFSRLISRGDFADWWGQTCVIDAGEKVFLLTFSERAWDIPWELLIKHIYHDALRATVSLVRTDTYAPIHRPSHFDEPLRILVLQGDDGEQDGVPLRLDLEKEQLLNAYKDLEPGFKDCVSEPVIVAATPVNLAQAIDQHRPHILWFSGHGTGKSNQALCLNGPAWVSAEEFARLIAQAAYKPIYAVFWACDTGQVHDDRRDAHLPAVPALYRELTKIGITSVLAMQARIRDSSARIMACDLLRFLARGYSLEGAVARTRANLMQTAPEGAHPLDWACPVVWSSGRIVDGHVWNSHSQPTAQLLMMGRQVIRAAQILGGLIAGASEDTELLQAATWASYPRLWIAGDSDLESAEVHIWWVRILQALQVQTNRAVFAVDLSRKRDDPEAVLKWWADQVIAWTSQTDLDDDIADALYEIRDRSTVSGWGILCSLCQQRQGILVLAIYDPPAYDPEHWFWVPLLDFDDTHSLPVVVLSGQNIDEGHLLDQNWQLERRMPKFDEQVFSYAVSDQPRLARALAVLNTPVRTDFIEASGLSLRQWRQREQMVLNTLSGPILAASARRYILDHSTPDELRLAHEDCAKILGHPQIDLHPSIREQRAEHCAKAGLIEEALLEVNELFNIYQREDRPSAILMLVERTELNPMDLPAVALLSLAWANLRLGKVDEAEFYAESVVPHTALDTAWKNAITAEIRKSLGDKQGALDYVTSAIDQCGSALADAKTGKQPNALPLIRQRLWGYRQDRARILQYLFYETEQAQREYEKLLSDKPTTEYVGAKLDIAIVQRNYAECLQSLAVDDADTRWEQARAVLAQAENNMLGQEYSPVFAEILYEKAKMAEHGNSSAALDYLVDCQNAARKSRHFMMLAIANSRLFWKHEQPFKYGRWRALESDLARFPYHGWAVRVLVDGRVHAAWQLEQGGSLVDALSQLKSNLDDLDRNPAFNQGSDRRRITATRAGLYVLETKLQDSSNQWTEFIDKYQWSGEWLNEHKLITPEQAWTELR